MNARTLRIVGVAALACCGLLFSNGRNAVVTAQSQARERDVSAQTAVAETVPSDAVSHDGLRLSAVEHQIVSLWDAVKQLQTGAPEATAQDAPATTEQLREALDPQKSEAAWRASVERIADAFAGETRDPEWAGARSSELGTMYGKLPSSGSRVSSIDCRASSCRVETTHPDAQALATFQRGMLFALPEELHTQTSTREQRSDGSIVLVTYLTP